MRNFKELKIWQKGIKIAASAIKITSGFPEKEKFGLSMQISKAAISIPANIAEGSGRGSEKDYRNFLHYSLGSAFELETHIVIALEVCYGDAELLKNCLAEVHEEQKMLSAFINKLEQYK